MRLQHRKGVSSRLNGVPAPVEPAESDIRRKTRSARTLRAAIAAAALLALILARAAPPAFRRAGGGGPEVAGGGAQPDRIKAAANQLLDGGPELDEIVREKGGCASIDAAVNPLPTPEYWARLRRLYREVTRNVTIRLHADPARETVAPAGFVPPLRAGQAGRKGRGVFATRDLRAGEMTYGGRANYAVFRDAATFRRFLAPLTRREACDVQIWTWFQRAGDDDAPTILLLLDDNAMQNDGNRSAANTGCPPGRACGLFDEYALRDIREGEELLCVYEDFYDYDAQKQFGL